ncbi:MAG: class I SAM-dependent methyltransferase [Aromatoleum sp.]|nr:class I SAM-dependent methyltransferase [Aromatoleum sp.]
MTSLDNTACSPLSAPSGTARTALPLDAPASTRMLFALLLRLARGEVTIHTPAGTTHRFGPGHDAAGRGEFTFTDWRLARDVLTGGDVAFAEAYMDGRWETPDLTALLAVLAHNHAALEQAFYGRWWQQALFRLKHWLNANSKRQARKNVVAHYDLGNDFYRLWLDSTMTYSSAFFGNDLDHTLPAAQAAKYERILAELALRPSAHILEIGCGWGGFAEAAARAGHRVTALSLSDAQTAYARDRLAEAGFADRVEFRLQDYRDERGTYDAVVSIEMFEAVGEKWWPAYFRKLREALRPRGRACIQTITIAEGRFERYRTQSDFIQQYIFPGGMLASPSRLAAESERAGLDVAGALQFGRDYAETLKRWLAAFDARIGAVRAQGFDERFIRCWRFYLAYCAAGFSSGSTDVGQYTLVAR